MKSICIVIIFIFLFSCKNTIQEAPPDFSIERNIRKEALLNLNKYVVLRNQDLIERMVERTGWKMKMTSTGLWYEIYIKGAGKPAIIKDLIKFCYSATLLDGTFCDSISISEPLTIKIGQGEIGSGLEEAFLLMNEGDHGRFIIPPHLNQGNFGNTAKIPPGSVILYDVYLIEILN